MPRERLTREEKAQREVGRTRVSGLLAALLTALLLVTALLPPAIDLGRSLVGDDGVAGAFAELGDRLPQVAGTFAEGRLLAANRELHAAITALEDRLEDGSVLRSTVLPWGQWALTRFLGIGNEEAYPGRRDWLFFRPGIDHLAGPGFLEPEVLERRSRGGDEWQEPPQPDPVRAILDFHRQLEARGIRLLVVPTPVKPGIHPEWFSRRYAGEVTVLRNPSFPAFVEALEAEGVEVFDPAPVLAGVRRESGETVYLARDTHWSPDGLEAVARALADRVATLVPDLPPPVSYRRRQAVVENRGDIANMLKLPQGSGLFPPERVQVQLVTTPAGRTWRPDESAPVLLLGDSFTNVYSATGLGWGTSAGLAEQLSFHLGQPLDRIALNAGGSHTTRQRLAEVLARGEDRLAGKRLVIYQFAGRELSVGDWKLIELP